MEYSTQESMKTALEAARKALPQCESEYKTSGKTTSVALLSMLLVTPLLLIALGLVCGGICVAYAALEEKLFTGKEDLGPSRVFGVLSFFLDVGLVIAIAGIPAWSFKTLSRLTGNRNPSLPGVLTGLSAGALCTALFLPIWDGATLAPTDLIILFIPVRWLFIIAGGVVLPIFAAAAAAGAVAEQKYCEEGGVFLDRYKVIDLDFDCAEKALAMLKSGQYTGLRQLPPPSAAWPKRKIQIVLWWQVEAKTAYLEMTASFYGKVSSAKNEEKKQEWLAFSARLSDSEASALAQLWAS